MEIGWIDFSKTDRDKVVGILDLLSEQGVLDELGIAQIRDGFSNLFFPGTTTVQTRAKYFLMIPYIFQSLESNPMNDYSKLKTQLNDLEINCAETILQKNYDEKGVIGKRSFDSEKQRINRNKWVKRPPSSIYWAGLKRYGIFRSDISIDQYLQEIYSKNSKKEIFHKSGHSNDSSSEGKDDKGAGDIQTFQFWKIETYEEDWLDKLEMDLTKDEAEFLKNQIKDSCSGSMLEFLLNTNPEDILEINSFSELGKIM